jgi:hypothetical protein
MHPDSRTRKEVWARINKATGHTVVVDGDAFYYKEGFGAFRLAAMQRVESKAELRRLVRGERRAAGGIGSGNFDHAGRPGEVGGSAPDSDGPAVTYADESVRLISGGTAISLKKWQQELDALPKEFRQLTGDDDGIDVKITPFFRNPNGTLRSKNSRGLYTPMTDDRSASIQIKPDAPPYVLAHELGHAFQTEQVESIADAWAEDMVAFPKLPFTVQHFVKHYSLSQREAFAQSTAFHLAAKIPNRAEFVRAFPKSIAATHKILAKHGIKSRQDP